MHVASAMPASDSDVECALSLLLLVLLLECVLVRESLARAAAGPISVPGEKTAEALGAR